MEAKKTYDKLKQKHKDLPEWQDIIYFIGIPDEKHLENVFKLAYGIKDILANVRNIMAVWLTPTNFINMHDQKFCKPKKQEILEHITKMTQIIREFDFRMVDALSKPSYEADIAQLTTWVVGEGKPHMDFFKEILCMLKDKWKTVETKDENNHMSY